MVADVYRVPCRGDIFMYARDSMTTEGRTRMLDIQPTPLHQRIGVVLGSKNEVEQDTAYHAAG